MTDYNVITEIFAAPADNWASIKAEFPYVKVKDFSKEVFDALKIANAELITEEVKRGGLTQRIIKSQAAYLKKTS